MKAVALALMIAFGLAGCAVYPDHVEVTRPAGLPEPILPKLLPDLIVVKEPRSQPRYYDDYDEGRYRRPYDYSRPCPPGHWKKGECY